MIILFTLTSVMTAALLFLVQPMVARMVLPAFGGSPQVWTTAMLFFQTALLAGYGYTHLATNLLSRKMQLWVHFVVLAIPLILLPIELTVAPSGKGGVYPSLELLLALALGVAVPFVVVATSGPLVQRWFSWSAHPRANDPYFLYAAGNIGSIGGLLLYPFVVEPGLSVVEQSRWWMYGYWLAFSLLVVCGMVVLRGLNEVEDSSQLAPTTPTTPVTWFRIGYWMLLAFVPSSLMLGITAHLSTDVASMPMLWVLPLVAYLLTFTIAFSKMGGQALRLAALLAPAVAVASLTMGVKTFGTNVAIGTQVLLMMVGGLIGHGKLAEDRPDPTQLTKFYFILSVGGALGGVFNGLIAPLIFPHVLEYGLAVAGMLALVTCWKEMVYGSSKWSSYVWIPLGLVLFFIPIATVIQKYKFSSLPTWGIAVMTLVLIIPLFFSIRKSAVICFGVLIASLVPPLGETWTAESIKRTFFGVHRVTKTDNYLSLVHGTTTHGRQDMASPESRSQPTTYYHTDQPLGDLVKLLPDKSHIGVVGLGAGTIAAYGLPNRSVTFHEIDPAVVQIAENEFCYVKDARERGATIEIVMGDGRLTLASKSNVYDLLAIDAFSSDAIPVHLLTIEAIQVYLNAIKHDGVIGVHISNRYLALAPVLAGTASQLKLSMLKRDGTTVAGKSEASEWVVVSRDPARIESLKKSGWKELPTEQVIWTDQRSSLWSVRKR
jgi:hypothetical protein